MHLFTFLQQMLQVSSCHANNNSDPLVNAIVGVLGSYVLADWLVSLANADSQCCLVRPS